MRKCTPYGALGTIRALVVQLLLLPLDCYRLASLFVELGSRTDAQAQVTHLLCFVSTYKYEDPLKEGIYMCAMILRKTALKATW
jgi:hypothetical protein